MWWKWILAGWIQETTFLSGPLWSKKYFNWQRSMCLHWAKCTFCLMAHGKPRQGEQTLPILPYTLHSQLICLFIAFLKICLIAFYLSALHLPLVVVTSMDIFSLSEHYSVFRLVFPLCRTPLFCHHNFRSFKSTLCYTLLKSGVV